LAWLATLHVALAIWASPAAQPAAPVLVIDIKGAIGVASSEQLRQAVERARSESATLLVVRIDTPGGLVSSTRDMIQTILASPVPVAIYVSPGGAHAASAGTYIIYAGHVAAMAPGTNLGAATPIQLGAPGLPAPPEPQRRPGDSPRDTPRGDTALERKVINDAVAFIRSLAQLRGRNAEWAERAVREAATLSADDALAERVIDHVARDLDQLLGQVDGRRITTAAGERVIATRDRPVVAIEPGFKTRLLMAIADPNLAFILLLLGIYGILFEFWHPGAIAPGVVGAISLVVALAALTVLPVDMAGLALVLLGIALMTAEAFTPGVGVMGIGGLVAFVFGALFLFDPSASDIDIAVAWPVIAAGALTSGLLSMGALGFALRARRRRVVTGAEAMIGATGRVVSWDDGSGRIRVQGEIWTAQAARGFAPGDSVRVVRRDGLRLIVERA
jgi:membrane-bound serine protease (ClpP class)